MSAPAVADAIRRILARHPLVFEAREEGSAFGLREVATGKSLRLETGDIEAFEEKESPGSGGPYLVLRFGDGRQLVLCYAGFAFSPSFVNTGPVPGAPQVVCVKDFHTLLGQLRALVGDPERRAEALELVRLLIALLDGARAAGLETGEEERLLDGELRVLEG